MASAPPLEEADAMAVAAALAAALAAAIAATAGLCARALPGCSPIGR